MVLNDEQNELFFDVMDSLLYYVNERFRVVSDFTLDYTNALGDVKSSLVARTLWDNVAIIDDFVAENPYGLSRRCLDIALSWKNALPGYYTLVRYQSGRALLMNDAGVFSVCGVTYELEGEIGPAPAYVEMVLLPFEGLIVYDGFLQAYDTDRTMSDAQRIQDEFENRCAKGIVSTEAEFARCASEYLAAQRDKELEALLADVSRDADSAEEVLPEGIHRGVLAGLSPAERQAARDKWTVENAPKTMATAKEFDRRVHKREPETSLSACLALYTKPQLESLARVLGMGGLSRLKKAEMVDELAAELPRVPQVLEARLAILSSADYDLVRTLTSGNPVTFDFEDRSKYAWTWPAEPYVFMFRGKGGYTVLVPDELQPLLKTVDFDALDRLRRQQRQALNCIEACVVTCGVMLVDDVYDQYRSLVSDVLPREDFDELIEFETRMGTASFDLWNYPPHDYLVHYTLTPDFIAEEFALTQYGGIGHIMRNVETGEVSTQPLDRLFSRMKADLASELEWLEQYKRELVESQTNMPVKPLSRTILENDVIGELLDYESVVRLRAFLDAHVPDGENDYTFADRVAEGLVMTAIESGTFQEMAAYAMDMGLDRCSHDEERLVLLVTNVFNAMPSWENNGWSPQELYEQVTGRKVFYNEDGTVMRIGADDACPCGSGKKYRDCCGR